MALLTHMYAESYLDVIQVKPLPWQSEEANDILRHLDDRILSNRPPQLRHQAIQGDNSSRTSNEECKVINYASLLIGYGSMAEIFHDA